MVIPSEFVSVTEKQINFIRRAFQSYSGKFRNEDPDYNHHMELKQFHTAKVCDEILDIAKSLGMHGDALYFAELLGWLHDIGRFEQYHQYRTFSDTESENHSEIGIRVIQQEKLLIDLPESIQEIVYRSVLNHNIPRVPEQENEVIDFYSRLLRDADKIDIWRVSLEMNVFYTIRKEALPGSYEVPNELLLAFENSGIITIDQIQSFFDSILFRASWLYDINFARTFEIINERNIISRLLNKLPGSPELEKIYQLTGNYLQSRLTEKILAV